MAEAIGRRVFEEVWNERKLDVMDETHAPDFVWHGPEGQELHGHQGYRDTVKTWTTAFPDHRFVIEDQIIAGDKEIYRWSSSGTHTGPLGAIAPTGNKMSVGGLTIVRISDGKIAEEWSRANTLGALQQIGVIPAVDPYQK